MNTGTTDVVVSSATVTGPGITATSMSSNIFDKGSSESVTLTLTGAYTSGSAYNIELLSTKGNKFSYTTTA
jgi:hypothetical protein